MSELSPQAWAVLEAAYQAPDDGNATRQSVAAALRAAAEQGETLYLEGCPVHAVTVGNLFAIATELDAQ
jgi:glycine/D-amino acid oxidase-like deaminating enzyme